MASREAQLEALARCVASLAPDEDWPSNEELGGSLTGTRDDEYRRSCCEQAAALLDGPVAAIMAERYAEVERLRAQLAEWESLVIDPKGGPELSEEEPQPGPPPVRWYCAAYRALNNAVVKFGTSTVNRKDAQDETDALNKDDPNTFFVATRLEMPWEPIELCEKED